MATPTTDSAQTVSPASSGVVIETPRLRMRSYRINDLTDLVALAGNWEVARWTGTIPHPYTETDGRDWIAKVQENHATGRPRRFAIALKQTDRLIGGVGLDGSTGDSSEEPALGYWVGQPYWGNGYAREAPPPSSVTGCESSEWKPSAPTPTRGTWPRKRSFCTAA